jgi:dephospho-CoA kinase
VVRGENPEWYDLAVKANQGDSHARAEISTKVHSSEWSWVGHDFDYVIDNNSTLENLYHQINQIIKSQV